MLVEITRVVPATVIVPQTVVGTRVVVPTATPPPPTPTITVLFEDNFDNGFRPEWQVIRGNWRTIDKRLSVDPSDGGEILVGDEQWTDYAVEMDIKADENVEWAVVQIILRDSDGKRAYFNLECRYFYRSGVDFGVADGGDPRRIIGRDVGCGDKLTSGTLPVRVVVRKDLYSFYMDGKLIIEIQDQGSARGKVGVLIWGDGQRFIDNFKVTSLP